MAYVEIAGGDGKTIMRFNNTFNGGMDKMFGEVTIFIFSRNGKSFFAKLAVVPLAGLRTLC